EVGAWAYPCQAREGLHVNEAEFIAELVDPATGRPASEGEAGEVVLTSLGRPGWPVIRYRTGDLVRQAHRACGGGRAFLFLPGGRTRGTPGRSDDRPRRQHLSVGDRSHRQAVRRGRVPHRAEPA